MVFCLLSKFILTKAARRYKVHKVEVQTHKFDVHQVYIHKFSKHVQHPEMVSSQLAVVPSHFRRFR